MTKKFPESESDWRKKSHEMFEKFVRAAEEDKLQDLINFVVEGEQTVEDLSISVTEATKEMDWGEWADGFNNGSLDLVVNLTHRVILPPRHDVRIIFSPDREVNKILFRYEYYFDHVSLISLESDDEIEPMIIYVKSLVFIRIFQHLLDSKEESILRFPLLGKILHRLYLLTFTAKDQELIYETKSTQLMQKLEDWIETYLDDTQRHELGESFDRYFEGVPEEQRGIWISM